MAERHVNLLHKKVGYQFGLTTAGWFFFLLMIFIIAAAVSSGHNLLYLTVCLFFGSFITMGNAAVMNLRGLQVERKEPEYLFAGTPHPVEIRLKNKRRLMDSFSLEVREISPRNEKPFGKVFFPLVGKGKEVKREYSLVLPGRGWHDLTGLVVMTRFPFGFWERSREILAPRRLLAFPRLFDAWPGHPSQLAVDGEYLGRRIGSGDDLLNFRDFQPGDPIRWIHWKNSAKTDRLTVALFHHPQNRQVIVCLKTCYDSQPSRTFSNHFEEAVSWAATAVVELLSRGISVGYMDETCRITPALGEGHKIQILTHLALVKHSLKGNSGSLSGDAASPSMSQEVVYIQATVTGVHIQAGQQDHLLQEAPHG
ncbi:MAG: DUF58 domain-containing protein [Candidatus Omnitrophica bacterium]|nr:MAG: hypothetical protein UZ16_OP3001001649 [Candidatus Hinthialibacteria bacterium OLB16]MBE7486740.1 DUF58 domain-containing protein [bacterium]MCC6733601.1 DUF58 domain-containing protein [Candidatus Omnitrophota bacterium]MCE7909534.1 DUF58 domain-containing protein [Candidatus Omnitrophica bacterium COP1]MBV6482105.1 hypothetical protein [bacterium]